MSILNKSVKHYVHVCCLLTVIAVYFKLTGFGDYDFKSPLETYGYTKAIFLYTIKLVTFLVIPIALLNFCGLTFYDAFRQDELKLRRATLLDPFISIRVVTKGDYPEMVRTNVQKNLNLCHQIGLDKFVIEVVTDRPVHLVEGAHVREIVVPSEYKTKNDARFKARALQYALENDVNMLSDDDWIVHLDEETLLTKSSVIGILNFLYENKHQIGQGSIAYGKQDVVNWLATLADSARVASDYGVLRFCLKTFHRPLFSFKGSFVVCKASVEREISFDHGLRGSIAEDSYFAIQAVNRGFTFDWIEGQMLEKSPFSMLDFIKQRKRWVQGLYLLVSDSSVRVNITKLGFTYSFFIWTFMPIQLINTLILSYNPISLSIFDDFFGRFNGAFFLYLFMFGMFKSFYFDRKHFLNYILCACSVVVIIPYVVVCETIAVVWGLFGDKRHFYVIAKQSDTLDV
jgi:egghead protein (zeste-white 4 protein)